MKFFSVAEPESVGPKMFKGRNYLFNKYLLQVSLEDARWNNKNKKNILNLYFFFLKYYFF